MAGREEDEELDEGDEGDEEPEEDSDEDEDEIDPLLAADLAGEGAEEDPLLAADLAGDAGEDPLLAADLAGEAEDGAEEEEDDGDDDDGEEGDGDEGPESQDPAAAEEKMDDARGLEADKTEAPAQKKRRGKPKDMNAPKRPVLPFYQFSATERARVVESNPDLKKDLGAMGRAMAELWAKVSQEKKDVMQAAYDKEKAVYDKRMAEYRKTDSFKSFQREFMAWKDAQEMKKLLKKQKLDQPPQPKSGYMAFGVEARQQIAAEGKGLGLAEIGKEVAARWAALGQQEQDKRNAKARAMREAWNKEMAVYRRTEGFRSAVDEQAALEVKQGLARLKADYEGRLPKRPPVPNQVFAAATGEKGTVAQVSARFKALPEEERAKYTKQTDELREKFKSEQAAFAASKEGAKYFRLEASVRQRASTRAARRKWLVDAPKRPPAVQTLYANTVANNSQQALPWGKLSEDERKKWEAEHAKQLQAHEAELAEFRKSDDYANFERDVQQGVRRGKGKGKAKAKGKAKGKAKAKAKSKATAKPEGMPKPPKMAMLLFAQAEGTQGGLPGIHKRWGELGPEGKKKYEEQHATQKAAYESAMAVWSKTPEGKKYLKAEETQKRKAAEERAKAKYLSGPGAPECPAKPKTAEKLFLEAKKEELLKQEPSLGAKGAGRRCAELWRGADAEAKKTFEAKAKSLQEVYEFELQTYKQTPAYRNYEKAISKLTKAKGKGKGARKGRGSKRRRKGSDDEMGLGSDMSGDSYDAFMGSDSDDSLEKLLKGA